MKKAKNLLFAACLLGGFDMDFLCVQSEAEIYDAVFEQDLQRFGTGLRLQVNAVPPYYANAAK